MELNNVPPKNPLRRLFSGFGFVLISCLSQQAIPQNLGNPWVPINVASNNSTFFFHAGTTKFFSFPPSLVSFNLLKVADGKASTYDRVEASCNNAEVKVNESGFVAIGSQNSVMHLILRALCGFATEDGYWIGLGADTQGARKNLVYFVNVRSITRVVEPFSGYSAQGTLGSWKGGQWPPFEISPHKAQWFYTCEPPYQYVGKQPLEESLKPAITVPHETPLGGMLSILCSGQFPVIQSEVNNLPDVKKDEGVDSTSLEDAKTKCKDLGFKPASEKFGDCVLRLSR